MGWAQAAILGISMLVLSLGPAALLVYAGYIERIDLANLDWTGVGSLAAIVTILINLVLLASVVVGFQTVREGQNTRTAELMRWAMEQMDKVKDDERVVKTFSTTPYSTWKNDPAATRSAQQVTNAYSRMAYFVNHQLVDISHFRKLWGVNICLYWLLLEEHICSEREKFSDKKTAGEGAFVRSDFELLAHRLIAHFDRTNPKMLDAYLKTLGRKRSGNLLHLEPIVE
ncbi:hypothetical protein [Aliihoeflea sp. 40Bstr573]|uniref:DUF4760 domain-containing protein n=1 Tax=Aliihoeflea sp. 40Bstr573 TaxID=2696467 RepID=UPI0020943B4C|nr:hypothetical protein [Aliihoeflea sp. 40Bstr573]MCO6386209.1 hypothetical protein [Aliihoeflea sp. 40Bstr573]